LIAIAAIADQVRRVEEGGGADRRRELEAATQPTFQPLQALSEVTPEYPEPGQGGGQPQPGLSRVAVGLGLPGARPPPTAWVPARFGAPALASSLCPLRGSPLTAFAVGCPLGDHLLPRLLTASQHRSEVVQVCFQARQPLRLLRAVGRCFGLG